MTLAKPLRKAARAVGSVTRNYRYTTCYIAIVVTILLVLELVW